MAGELSRGGVRLLDARFLMKNFLTPRGNLTRRKPSAQEQKTIQYGLAVSRQLARVSVGQTLLLKTGTVVAVEALEGTNKAIRRAGTLVGKGVILVKTSSPRQDWRFDVPTLGLTTLDHLAKIRATSRGVVVGGGQNFFFGERKKSLAFAARHGLFIQALSAVPSKEHPDASQAEKNISGPHGNKRRQGSRSSQGLENLHSADID